MKSPIQRLTCSLKNALINKLTEKGELKKGESISIHVVILTKKRGIRKTLTIDKEDETFALSNHTFYARELTDEEVRLIAEISWTGAWQQGVVLNILKRNNQSIREEELRSLALDCGYHSKWKPYPNQVTGKINRQLKDSDQPFRIVRTPKDVSGFCYSFHRIAEETL